MLLWLKDRKLSAILRLFIILFFGFRPILVSNPLQSNIGNGGHDFNWSVTLSLELPIKKKEWIQYVIIDTEYIEIRELWSQKTFHYNIIRTFSFPTRFYASERKKC